MSYKSSPTLISGTVNGNEMRIIPQDPNVKNAKTVYRSVNANGGVEFTWSVWLYINSLDTNSNTYKHIFSKGNSELDSKGIVSPNNAPGLYISPNTNELTVIMNTFEEINEEVVIPDIPLNKWFNVILRCENNTLDIFVNGTITRSVVLNGVPKQNYGDVLVALNGGFDGYISNLKYYNYSIGLTEVQSLNSSGPNRNLIGTTGYNDKDTDYLSLRWYIPSF